MVGIMHNHPKKSSPSHESQPKARRGGFRLGCGRHKPRDGKHPQVAEPRSIRSPGCNEVEPWVNEHESFQSPERAMLTAADLLRPFRTMGT